MQTYVSQAPQKRITSMLAAILFILLLAGCTSETIFQSNFDATPVNDPPAHTQQVGTINIDGPAGSVKVIAPPTGTGGKWAQVTRLSNQTSVSGMQCNFSKFIGAGEYTFSTVMFMPSGSGLATIQFEQFGQSVSTLTSFLHLDFTEDNKIRIDDNDATKFGSFSRNQAFIVQVTLNINSTVPTAHIVLSGAGTDNAVKDYDILPPFRG